MAKLANRRKRTESLPLLTTPIPAFVIEYFLLGKTKRDAIQRFTQDAGIVSDVWLVFAEDRSRPCRVLVAPSPNTPTILLGSALHDAIAGYRRARPDTCAGRATTQVSPLENFVAVTIYFDELLRILLPMTSWWHRKQLSAIQRKAFQSGRQLDELLEQAILFKLGHGEDESDLRAAFADPESFRNRVVLDAASLAALIGVFRASDTHPDFLKDIAKVDPRAPDGEEKFANWVYKNAAQIASAARLELSKQLESSFAPVQAEMMEQRKHTASTEQIITADEAPELIQRVFLDRKGSLAETDDGLAVIKADAAHRVFGISCNEITWAILDSGIARLHEAFLDHGAKNRRGELMLPPPSRVRSTYDFTRIQLIRNFDLKAEPEGPDRENVIAGIIEELAKRRAPHEQAEFKRTAAVQLRLIARQLDQKLLPDWSLIEPLIAMHDDDGSSLFSDHGTHVAGILGARWERQARDGSTEAVMTGVCPDIRIVDLRVVHERDRKSTEFALLAALEFVQFLNTRAAQNGPVIHGVNISMSIPHEVSNYGCGATPVCVACDRLSNSGVVVVAAAGNRGWNEQEIGFGNFVFASITDPGNAREAITVGSTHGQKPHTFGVSYFSSRGPTGDGRLKPDLVAPGEQIRGPVRGSAQDELDGTSMAAPFVSGAAAMLLARHRELIGNAARVKHILCDTATDLGREKYFQGHGLVDVLRALQSI